MRIKKSNRGLTFSFLENDTFRPGTHYRYIVDNTKSEVILIADPQGKYKISRKGANAMWNEEYKKAIIK